MINILDTLYSKIHNLYGLYDPYDEMPDYLQKIFQSPEGAEYFQQLFFRTLVVNYLLNHRMSTAQRQSIIEKGQTAEGIESLAAEIMFVHFFNDGQLYNSQNQKENIH